MLVFRGVYKLSIHLSIYCIYPSIYLYTYRALGFLAVLVVICLGSSVLMCVCFFCHGVARWSVFLVAREIFPHHKSLDSHKTGPHMQLCSKLLSWQPYGSRPLVSTPFFFAPKSNDSKKNLEKLCDSENWENPFLSIAMHEIDIL